MRRVHRNSLCDGMNRTLNDLPRPITKTICLMKTEISLRTNPLAGFARGGLRTAAAAAAMLFCAGNLLANTVTLLSGGPGAGYVDGDITTQALFNTPSGLAIDSSGNYLFVADRNNNAVRELEFDINTAGTILVYTNNVQANNLFSQPIGVALDQYNNLFVLDRGNGKNGNVLVFDYTGELILTNLSNITNAVGIAVDQNDNMFVTASNRVIEVTAGGMVTNLATITATNCSLGGIVVKHNGLLAVCDTGRNGILLINPDSGVVTTNAGFHGRGDFVSLNNFAYSNQATFFQPSGITESGDGTLIVTDFGNDRVKAVLANGIVTNVYGVTSNDWVSPWPGYEDGNVTLPDEPGGVAGRCEFGIVLAPDGSLYVSEDYYHILRHVTDTPFVPEPIPPSAPSGLTAIVVTNAGALQVNLQWTASQSGVVTNYLVEVSKTSGGPYTIIGTTTATTFIDTGAEGDLEPGYTNYYVIQAEGSDTESLYSNEAGVGIPVLPPAPPVIGWFDYEWNGLDYISTFHPLTNGPVTVDNDLNYAITNPVVIPTYYISGLTPLPITPTNGDPSPPQYQNGVPSVPSLQTPLPITVYSNLTIEAISKNAGGYSSIATAQITYQCAAPAIIGNTNAAQFYLSDVTTNVIYFYTTDGTDPLTNQLASQEIVATNLTMPIGIDISTNFVFSVRAFRGGYLPSGLLTNIFLAQNFLANELTWGFASGYCSSTFVGSPGEIFYAPVTLTTLGNASIYSMGFDMVVTNLGAHAVPPGDFYFEPMLMEPATESNTDISVLTPIPPYEFVGEDSSPPPPSQLRSFNNTNFVDLEITDTNLNELAVSWFEMYGKTNLYNTTAQTLISHSEAFIEEIPDGSHPNQVIVGGYAFQIPTNAVPGEQYEIQFQRPSADNDGIGGNGANVVIEVPTTGSLSNGPVNGIKMVTVGQPKYLVGDVNPFYWFNAGNFGTGDLINNWVSDVQDVFDAAIYQLNAPPAGSDFFDAMDSAGGIGAYDAAAGYWTNANITASTAQRNALFNVNDATTIDEMAFGDGTLDVCDVYVTLLRSQFQDLYWFQRFYTNDPVNGVFGRVAMAILSQTNVDGGVSSPGGSPGAGPAPNQAPISITNTPVVHFAAGDYQATADTTISVPVTATVYGLNPMRLLMFNAFVTPLDGSPALTSTITFSPNAPFNNTSLYNPPNTFGLETNSSANCAETFLPVTFPIPSNVGIIGSNIIGYLNIPIPANATSSSAYAISFAHASGSPNGLISFPKTTYTGLITLSSRTNSTYNDGIPDTWRLRYFGTIYNQLSVSNADADGTGLNNWQKYLAGLNPTDPTSVLNEGTDQPMAQNPQDLVLYWPSVSGQTYIIKRSPTLFPGQWTSISTNIGDGTYMEIHDTSGGSYRYYQVTTP